MEAAMREAWILVMAALALGQGVNSNSSQSFEQPFAEGGVVTLRLSPGDYFVRAGDSAHVTAHWYPVDVADTDEMKKVKVRAEASGNAMTIRTDGPTKKARMIIELPQHSDLRMRLRAGDVRIVGIEGNKNISMTAGDLVIEGTPASYSHVHASVTFGDLRAQPLGINKDGIRNSFNWSGSGKYTLDASLFAGDLTMRTPLK